MKKLILSAVVATTLVTNVLANDSVTVSKEWTSSSLREAQSNRPAGDAASGAQLNESLMCSSCHGKEGLPPTNRWPSVAGQLESYTYKMLLDYQSGARNEDNRANIMTAVADMMTPQDMADVAAYYASLQAPTLQQQAAPTLVTDGDKGRLITACASCHGLSGQGGIKGTPAITGQTAETLKRALEMYRSGDRDSDLYSVMRQASQRLTDSEIDSLADYYSGNN